MQPVPSGGGTLVFGRGGDSAGLDPAYETDGNSFMICDNIFESLVAYKDESTELEPGLATSWEITPDGKTYTFHLRKDVKFHDGTFLLDTPASLRYTPLSKKGISFCRLLVIRPVVETIRWIVSTETI